MFRPRLINNSSTMSLRGEREVRLIRRIIKFRFIKFISKYHIMKRQHTVNVQLLGRELVLRTVKLV